MFYSSLGPVSERHPLFFGSDKMTRVSAVYHTIISTCKMQGVSVLDYFKRFFSEIVKGRRDYEHLLPLTNGLDQQVMLKNCIFNIIY